MRKVLVLLTDRANYGRLKPVMRAVDDHPDLTLMVCCTGTMLIDRFKLPIQQVRDDGFTVDAQFACDLEGSTQYTQAKSAGQAAVGFADVLERLQPDCVVIIGDRYQAGGCAMAAHQANVPICHLQGGEVSGTRDDGARNAITQLATWHVPATQQAKDLIEEMRPYMRGGCLGDSWLVGCPSSDIAATIALNPQDFVLACYHPNTDHPQTSLDEAREFIKAIREISKTHQVKLLWPNIDAGSNEIADCLRHIRHEDNIRVYQNFPTEEFMQHLDDAACAVGNSSSFCRDSSFFGTPVVLVGDRQRGRERAENVIEVLCDDRNIVTAFHAQVGVRFEKSTLFGDGNVSQRIADGLAKVLHANREECAA